jgi:hypothetical protein
MGIEDPGWSRLIIVIGFLAVLLAGLYYSRSRGKGILSKFTSNQYISVEETIAISNISRASIIIADSSRFLVIHGKGQSPTLSILPEKTTNDNLPLKIEDSSNIVSKEKI